MIDSGPEVVLIVDDEAANRKLMADLVRIEGREPIVASGGREALDVLERRAVDLVLLDMMMPEMSGLEVLDELARRGITPALPVVVVTALTEREHRLAALQKGAADFLGKPIDRQELACRVRNLVGMKRMRDRLEGRGVHLDRIVREQAEHWRALVANVPALVVALDPDGTIVSVNGQAQVPPDAVVGQPLDSLVLPEHRDRLRSTLNDALAAQAVARCSAQAAGGDGAVLDYDIAIAPIHAAGRLAAVVLLAHDVTSLKRAEAAILREKTFSEAMLDSLPGVVFLFDHTGRLLRWNRSFETLSGYSVEEIAAMRVLDFFDGEDRTLIEERIRKVFEAGAAEAGVAEAEAALLAKDGRRTPHYLVGVRFAVDGVPCCLTTGIDLSARRHLEEQLRQSQKIEAIGQLAGGVAHDFNNMLGVIMGHGELALRHLGSEDPVRGRVDQMLKAAACAAALTHQLLAFSRKQILQPRLLDLNATVADTHKMLGRLIGEDIDVVVHPALNLGTVNADPGQVEQIILNLAVNARDAMPKGGRLTLETANADLDEDYAAAHPGAAPGPYVMLAISDTGVGMDQATQLRIFEPFFTTKPEGEGTGLGLATVYGIVKQSGGCIWVYSEPGRGTTFKVYLPRVDEPTQAAPAGVAGEAPRGHETILLVEDSEPLQEMIREMLEESGYTVLLASNGEDALALARGSEGPIDLLLTDVVMPKLGGGDLAKRLVALRPGLRVLYMSGYTEGAISQHGVLGEGVMLLEKPFTGDRLARAVREALDGPTAK